MTSAEFSPAPFAVPTAATPDAATATNNAAPGVTLPNLEYTLYQPKQLKSRIPALMIHASPPAANSSTAAPAGSANTCAPDTPC